MSRTHNSTFNIQHSKLKAAILLGCLLGLGTASMAADLKPAVSAPKESGAFLGYKTAIQIGLEQHPLVKKSQQSALAADAVTQQAKAHYYPQIDAYPA
ncbi:MAG: hypothetical protein HY205_05865 [Nitrospirae bacterium]|nr:hypothetical protein [Nitrospirota bacterium]